MAVTTLMEHMPNIDARIIATVCTSWFKYVEDTKVEKGGGRDVSDKS